MNTATASSTPCGSVPIRTLRGPWEAPALPSGALAVPGEEHQPPAVAALVFLAGPGPFPRNPAKRTGGIRCPGLAASPFPLVVRMPASGSGRPTGIAIARTARRG